jgi:hypothetical protein
VLKRMELKTTSASFRVDTEANISRINESKLKHSMQINKEKILAIVGITPGE